ncbi:DUF74-domain-containing protein [Mollisia scopiformis]|uniref:DUF74-domain-containing protein n=1 Tax=Mollisia scopiformis TaxID=149040 RepID=A0A194X141_MOLSC|nr:DUF74-domain-containing protein [Mollisia scopiformis]KUJ13910.1 DUF74-domain-containing protein [Mollisia scopiformis]
MRRSSTGDHPSTSMTTTTKDSSKPPSKGKSKEDANDSIPVPSCFIDTHGVITSTMNDLPGYRVVKILGTVYGITVRSRNWGADIGAFLRSSVGGEIRYFTNLMYASRDKALERMVGECMARGGNAVVALRFDQAEVNTFSQVCAYGTACLVERIEDGKKEEGGGEQTINSMQRL